LNIVLTLVICGLYPALSGFIIYQLSSFLFKLSRVPITMEEDKNQIFLRETETNKVTIQEKINFDKHGE
jgi:hypothetical protein